MKRVIVLLIGLTVHIHIGNAQEVLNTNLRHERPLGFTTYIGGPGYFGISFDYFITPTTDVEINFGWGLSGGFKYHFKGNKPLISSPYVGITTMIFPDIHEGFFGGVYHLGFYLPLGIQYFGNNGFTFAVEAAGLLLYTDKIVYGPSAGIKIGYRF